jgi:YidC/Oxa1 family membrane protein insertase
MIAMQRLQPEIKRLQQKHKGDREALNREMMAFYQQNNVNPFSSCLPLLLQMPVFIVLYQVLAGLTRRSEGSGSNFNPKYFEGENTPIAVALRATDRMMSFGMDLSQSALNELKNDGLVTALPFIILVGLVAGTAYVQQRQIAGRTTLHGAQSPVNPQQQLLMKIMPFIFIPISVSLPAGVVIYFVVSNLVRIGQQYAVTRLEYGPKAEARRAAKPSRAIEANAVEKDATEKDKAPSESKNNPKERPSTGPAKSGPPGGTRAVGAAGNRGGANGRTPRTGPSANGRTSNGAAASRSRARKRKRK